MGVYTKTGDQGETGLYTGEVENFVDKGIQKLLPLLMADLASLGQAPLIKKEHVEDLERGMDEMEAALPPLASFLIPGDTQGGAALDLARTVARRAERSFSRLAEQEEVHDTDRIFLNRISDYCFLLMRTEEQ